MILTHGNTFEFYIPNDLVGYINKLQPLTQVNCDLQVTQRLSKTGVTTLSVKLLNIDGVLSNEED